MNLSTYTEQLLAKWLRGSAFPPPPAKLLCELSSVTPTDASNALVTPRTGIDTDNGYAAQVVTLGAPTFDNVKGTTVRSNAALTFGPAKGTDSWRAMAHAAVRDEAGNHLFYSPMAAQRRAGIGDTISFDASQLAFTLRVAFSKDLAEALVNWFRGQPMLPPPSKLECAISTAAVLADGSGIKEPSSAHGYARQLITFSEPRSVVGQGTTMVSTIPMVFGPAHTADWKSVSHSAIFGDGKLLLHGPLVAPRLIEVGDAIPLAVGSTTLLIR